MLVGHASDEHTDEVERVLHARKRVAVERLSREALPGTDMGWQPRIGLRMDRRQIRRNGGRAGLWRRPSWPLTERYADQYREFVLDECVDAFDGALHADISVWITHPSVMRTAELKAVQLDRAAALRLSIPRTLITNDGVQAQAFAKALGDVVVKPVRYGLVQAVPARVTYTSTVEADDLAGLAGVPVIVQERIRAKEHLRIVTIGRSVFAATLTASELDWRARVQNHDAFELARGRAAELASAGALALADALGIGYSAQDWVVTAEGGAVFLEANPNGQWLFLDPLWDGGITREMASQLESLAGAGRC